MDLLMDLLVSSYSPFHMQLVWLKEHNGCYILDEVLEYYWSLVL